jgi:hypothetical protein
VEKYYHYYYGGQTLGPRPAQELKDMITSGVLPLNTLVWTEGLKEWATAAETELGITDLLRSVILFLIAHSNKKKFSKSKLESYIIMINDTFPLGILVNRDRYGSLYVVQLNFCLKLLKSDNLIEEINPSRKRGVRARKFISSKELLSDLLPSNMTEHIYKLILQWDDKGSSQMRESYAAQHSPGTVIGVKKEIAG